MNPYRHQRLYARAAERPEIPYLGAHETALSNAWDQAWADAREHLDGFGQVALAPGMLISQLTLIATHAAWTFEDTARHYYEWEIQAGMTSQGAVEKARNPFRAGTEAARRWAARNGISSTDPVAIARDGASDIAADLLQIARPTMRVVKRIIKRAMKSANLSNPNDQLPTDVVRATARELADVLGLNERWALAVDHLRQSMIANGVQQRWVDARARKYAVELTHKRGVMVARTELMKARNIGAQMYWQMEQESGRTKGYRLVKWLETMPGACPECIAASDPDATGQPKRFYGLDTSFVADDENFLVPPLHPHCRCTVGYELEAE